MDRTQHALREPRKRRPHAAVRVLWHPMGSENAKRLPDGKAQQPTDTVVDWDQPPLVASGRRLPDASRSAAGSQENKPSEPLATFRSVFYRAHGWHASTFSDVTEKSHNNLGPPKSSVRILGPVSIADCRRYRQRSLVNPIPLKDPLHVVACLVDGNTLHPGRRIGPVSRVAEFR